MPSSAHQSSAVTSAALVAVAAVELCKHTHNGRSQSTYRFKRFDRKSKEMKYSSKQLNYTIHLRREKISKTLQSRATIDGKAIALSVYFQTKPGFLILDILNPLAP